MIALHPSPAPVSISRTRLAPPHITGVAIHRPELHARLNRALSVPLTLMIAPAGHGKTRTLVEWSEETGWTTAWFSLSPREAELTRFAAHLAAALDRAHPGLAGELYHLLTAPDRLDPHDLGEQFADALYELADDLLLIIDDFHSADVPVVTQFMTGLILAGPARLHTVIGARRPPGFSLARMRAHGLVEELNASDLRFSLQDTARLLHVVTGVPAPPEIAARIHAAVGGWPAAVRLLAIGFDADGASSAPAAPAANLDAVLLLDYLSEEVLSNLVPAQRNLLLLAALPERFNAGLLATLATALSTPYRPADLDTLRSLDLFREVPGQDDTWYVYHPLFRDTFLRQLTSDYATRLDTLHRLAAAWFRDAGLTRDAVWHLVQAGDITGATALIEARVSAAFDQEDWQGISSWLNLIPESDVRSRPSLLLAAAWVAFLSGRGGRLAAHLEELQSMGDQGLLTEDQDAQAAILAYGSGVFAGAAKRPALEVAADVLPRMNPAQRYRYGYAHMMIGMALTDEGQVSEALRRLEAFTLAESASVDAASIRGFFGRVLVLWQVGQLTACLQVAEDQKRLAAAHGLPVSAGWAELFIGLIAHERGQIEQAQAAFAAVIAAAERLHFSSVLEAFTRQTLMYQLQGQEDEADRTLARLREIIVSIAAPEHLSICDSLAARLALFRGELTAAASWLANTPANPERFDFLHLENPVLTRVLVLLSLAEPAHRVEAAEILADLRQRTGALHTRIAALDIQVLTAYLHEHNGESRTATLIMRDVLLALAGEQAFHRLAFLPLPLTPLLRRAIDSANLPPATRTSLEFQAARLLARPTPDIAQRDTSAHVLTGRELDVLHCLSLRLTNNEIGDELYISPVTVKNHVAHISEKLGVSGRRAVVQRANELGLFPTGT